MLNGVKGNSPLARWGFNKSWQSMQQNVFSLLHDYRKKKKCRGGKKKYKTFNAHNALGAIRLSLSGDTKMRKYDL